MKDSTGAESTETEQVCATVVKPVANRLKIIAAHQNRSISSLVGYAIYEFLGWHQGKWDELDE